MNLFTRSVALMLSSCLATSAWAQVGPGQPISSGAADQDTSKQEAGQIADIVVTAQKRSENLQRVPIAITAITSSQFEAAAIQTTAKLASITPSLTFANANAFISPRIRGIGSSAAGPGVENSVATYIDGVYIASAPGTLISLGNVARVEVLKGPQGTLFGRNATGGLIQVVTADPANVFGGKLVAGYGNYGTVRGNGYIDVPLAEGVAANFAFSASHQERGYGTNLTTGSDIYKMDRDVALRAKIVAHLGDRFTARLAVDYENQLSSDPAFAPAYGSKPTLVPDRFFPPSRWDTATNVDSFHKTESDGASVGLGYDLGAATLTSITAYCRLRFDTMFDGDISPVSAAVSVYTQKDRQISQELQITSNGNGPFKWIAGLYYFDLDSRYDPYDILQGPVGAQSLTRRLQTSTTRSYAGFGQVSYLILPRTTVTAGIRYTEDQRSLIGTTTAVTAAGVTTSVTPNNNNTTYRVPTWRFSVDHQFSDEFMAYISYNRGYKSGGYNAQSPTAPAYAPEKLDAYEVGLKSLTFDRKLRVNAAFFYYKYRDIQVNTFIGVLGVIYNGARAENYGVDIDADLAVSSRLKLTGGMTALHDRFTSFPLAVIATILPNGGATTAPGSATGNRLPFAPDVTTNLGFDYMVPVGRGRVNLVANDLYSSGFFSQPDNVLRQPSYHLLNASLTWHSPGGQFSVSGWSSNLLNKAVVVSDVVSSVAQILSLQAPRTYGFTISKKF